MENHKRADNYKKKYKNNCGFILDLLEKKWHKNKGVFLHSLFLLYVQILKPV